MSDATILNSICATKKKFNPSLVTAEMQREQDAWDAFEGLRRLSDAREQVKFWM